MATSNYRTSIPWLDAALFLFLLVANYVSYLQHHDLNIKQYQVQKQTRIEFNGWTDEETAGQEGRRHHHRRRQLYRNDENNNEDSVHNSSSSSFSLSSFSRMKTSCQSLKHLPSNHHDNNNNNNNNKHFTSVAVNSSWMGNVWIPPPGFRYYSVHEFQEYFMGRRHHHSILFVGDSTARRTYATLYAILNSTTGRRGDNNNDDDVSFWDLDNPAVIDVNKKETTEECSKPGLALCRHVSSQEQLSSSSSSSSAAQGDNRFAEAASAAAASTAAAAAASDHSHHSSSAGSNLLPLLSFDLMGGRCPADIEALAKSSFQNRMNDYSLIIISMGAAELNDMCDIVSSFRNNNKRSNNNNNNNNNKKKKKKPLGDYLAAVRELLSIMSSKNSNVTIVWRTMGNIGWPEDQQGLISLHKAQYRNVRIVNRIQRHELQQQQQQQQQFNTSTTTLLLDDPSLQRRKRRRTAKMSARGRVTVLDWGKVIEPRSYPFQDRIAGDIPPHYGLEARIVFLQMLINHLMQLEQHDDDDDDDCTTTTTTTTAASAASAHSL